MGKRFTGKSLMGYDNTRQAYNYVWVSDMQTSMFTCEGKGENGNKTITLEGRTDCPATRAKKCPDQKRRCAWLGRTSTFFEMFDTSQGRKTMEITYTRK